ncbi:hypothetical protein Sjap_005978 [Stephania japonica]|uniref:CRM domain-containing protein n=1 Tax=Stephania japonica TaxID=461633 RepID=A0AAP0K664_9MAGN
MADQGQDEEEDIKEAFNVFDQNRDGFITVEELNSVLSTLGLKQGRTLEDCKRMIKNVDVDGDGMIDFKEFKQMMRKESLSEPYNPHNTLSHNPSLQLLFAFALLPGAMDMVGISWYSSSCRVLCKVLNQICSHGSLYSKGSFIVGPHASIHSTCLRNGTDQSTNQVKNSEQVANTNESGGAKLNRKKLKGKRAVVRWLKFFRYKKKKEYERMTAEEKILYKLRKAQNKEARLVEALKKIEPPQESQVTHDPEILTPEEHFYFLKMGVKCKNYVPVGRRGIYQGVILNMHLHWKKHQTLKVIVKTFTPEEVKDIAAELARLSGGIVLDIQEENTIVMYRGKNYAQPPTEIMSPRSTLPRKKLSALDKSKYRDGLRAVRKYIPRLEQDLELLKEQAKLRHENKAEVSNENQDESSKNEQENSASHLTCTPDELGAMIDRNDDSYDEDSMEESGLTSDSEPLSDMFETDTDEEANEKVERPLYLDEFEKFPVDDYGESEDFEEHLRQISLNSKKGEEGKGLPELDEVDKIFLSAGSLLKKTRR